MKKILVTGASGVLGMEILKVLQEKSYHVRAFIKDPDKKARVLTHCQEVFIGNSLDADSLQGLCDDIDIVISAIGKSVSLFTHHPGSFYEVDYEGDMNILREAQKAGVQRFVYTSMFGSETSPDLPVGWSQELFTRQLKQSGLGHTVVKTVGTFTGLHDLLLMGRAGIIVTPGNGKPVTNPIHPHDLAVVCVDQLEEGPEVLEVGGPEIHSRQETADMISDITQCPVNFNIPLWMVRPGLVLIKLFNRNLHAKLKQFTFITTNDMVAPAYGSLTLKPYMEQKNKEMEVEGIHGKPLRKFIIGTALLTATTLVTLWTVSQKRR